MRMRLAEADRQRLKCPEFLPLTKSISSLNNREAIAIKKLGFPTPRLLAKALTEPGQYEAWTAAVWLGLRRVGIEVDLDTLEFDINVEVVDEEPELESVVEEGKAEEAPEASTS